MPLNLQRKMAARALPEANLLLSECAFIPLLCGWPVAGGVHNCGEAPCVRASTPQVRQYCIERLPIFRLDIAVTSQTVHSRHIRSLCAIEIKVPSELSIQVSECMSNCQLPNCPTVHNGWSEPWAGGKRPDKAANEGVHPPPPLSGSLPLQVKGIFLGLVLRKCFVLWSCESTRGREITIGSLIV